MPLSSYRLSLALRSIRKMAGLFEPPGEGLTLIDRYQKVEILG